MDIPHPQSLPLRLPFIKIIKICSLFVLITNGAFVGIKMRLIRTGDILRVRCLSATRTAVYEFHGENKLNKLTVCTKRSSAELPACWR